LEDETLLDLTVTVLHTAAEIQALEKRFREKLIRR
jgi:hypothetical protein